VEEYRLSFFGNSNSATIKGPILFDSPHIARVSSYPGITFPKLQGYNSSCNNIELKNTKVRERNSVSTPLEKLRIENRHNTSDSLINRIITHAERCRSRDTTRKGSPRTGLTDENCFDYISNFSPIWWDGVMSG
jgi:hypothetical protein